MSLSKITLDSQTDNQSEDECPEPCARFLSQGVCMSGTNCACSHESPPSRKQWLGSAIFREFPELLAGGWKRKRSFLE